MKPQYQTFALEKAKGATNVDAYLKAFPATNRDSAGASGARLAAKEEIKNEVARIRQSLVKVEEDTLTEVKEQTRALALTMADYREIIHRIATGKIKRKVWDAKKGDYVFEYPTPKDRLDAIKLDAELTGVGFRPPEDGEKGGGNTYNTFVRKVVFNTRVTTSKQEIIQNGE